MDRIMASLKDVLWWVNQRVVGQINGWSFIKILPPSVRYARPLGSKLASVIDEL